MAQPVIGAALAAPLALAIFSAPAHAQATVYKGVYIVRLDYKHPGDIAEGNLQIYTEDPKTSTSHITPLWYMDWSTGNMDRENDTYLSMLQTAYSQILPVDIEEDAHKGLVSVSLTAGD
ncbi:hypothetical protein [Dyella choica]|uniref:Uncharacterized protein n=1 Tax=Dyella choica TaxID=1927959 RepID=A0A3S0R2W2_9GAMM|nr:hypothetical protein [Dyella choica]RUL74056.1 hypothetical protein EKH80_14595 [Dyella choica]